MRHKLNLDLTELNGFSMLLHGGYAVGKTHFVGDMLREESQYGPVRFLNVKGEDGYRSLASLGLGENGESVDSLDDFSDALKEWRGLKLQAVAIDSFKPLVRLVMYDIFKEDRLPRVGGKENEWGPVHFKVEGIANSLRSVAKYVLCTCPSDKSVNQLDGRTYITPDLPGREAAGSAGWFDMVAYLKADSVSATKVIRELIIRPDNSVITRQRLPRAIVKDIIVPENGGGWHNLKVEIQKALNK